MNERMSIFRFSLALAAASVVALGAVAARPSRAEEPQKGSKVAAEAPPAAASFDRLKALAGDWIDVDGTSGMKDRVAVTYRLTGAGSAVVETLFPGTPHEMMTVYHKDGRDLVLTHYCSAGNQPRMRATAVTGNVIAFAFDGGTNVDPSKDMHMHAARIELVSPDEIRSEWVSWEGGKPTDHVGRFHLKRKTS